MAGRCPELETLQAAAERGGAQDSTREHIRGCARCLGTVESLERLSPLLGELARTAGRRPAPEIWPGVSARLESPRLADRLPPAVAASLRMAAEFARPAAAAAVAVGLAGVLAGAWFAIAWRSRADASAGDPYVVSSLVGDPGDGLASAYEFSFESQAESRAAPDPAGGGEPGRALPAQDDSLGGDSIDEDAPNETDSTATLGGRS